MKICGKCKVEKEEKEFSPSQFKESWGRCRVCIKEVNKANKDKIRAQSIALIDKKVCAKCTIEKDSKEFAPSQLKGNWGWCRECQTISARERREKLGIAIKQTEKICSRCKSTKERFFFSKYEFRKENGWCQECKNNNPDIIQCITCDLVKSINEFEFRTDSHTYRSSCKECREIYRKNYQNEHKEESKIYRHNYYELNKEHTIITCKEYRNTHKEETRIYQQNFYQNNKFKINE